LAADDVLHTQTETLALQRRIGSDMRDIWAMQPRFERRVGKSPYRLITHPRFRAGLDFLILRATSGEITQELADWWTQFLNANEVEREALIYTQTQRMTQKNHAASHQKPIQATLFAPANEASSVTVDATELTPPPKKRRRRRSKKPAASDAPVANT
jgi:poly(A) polymerase